MTQILEGNGRNVEVNQKHASATGTANTDLTLTIPADANHYHVLDTLWFSYSGTPTGGRLTITIGSDVLLDHDITSGGPGPLPLHRMNSGKKNEAVAIKLFAAGAGVVGKLSVQYF